MASTLASAKFLMCFVINPDFLGGVVDCSGGPTRRSLNFLTVGSVLSHGWQPHIAIGRPKDIRMNCRPGRCSESEHPNLGAYCWTPLINC
jgi:hypothetical protein